MKFAWLCSHESYQPEDLVRQAVAAEEAGFDVVLGSDHFHPWVDDTSAAGFVWSWLALLGALIVFFLVLARMLFAVDARKK